ncbi:UNVERIFIED_CONTAM: hypothetical protein FKN15_053472 [Acipenser sinensis]
MVSAPLKGGVSDHVTKANKSISGWLFNFNTLSRSNSDPSLWTVVLGQIDLSSLDPSGILNGVQRIIVHPAFDSQTMDNDMALLELNRSVTFTDFIMPVCLAESSSTFYTDTECWATGWGATAEGENQLKEFLRKIGLEDHLTNKLTLGAVLEIGPQSVTDEPIRSLKDLPSHFLKRLMMVNVTARSTRCANAVNETQTDAKPADIDSFFDGLCSKGNCDDNRINPLDLITALFLCTDSFLQQEMMSKMSMCQFAVPLLLPDCSTNQCTLMLWAMRDIVKEWRPHSLAETRGFVEDTETRGFVEDSIVRTAMPMISFVSLGDCSLSKSQILNQVLSNPQQHHDFFIHRDMSGGDVAQEISNGLVEISWYLPCGNTNLDIFSEPIAIATLQGDICAFETQFSFLVQTSSAVFVFFDSIEENEYRLLASLKNTKSQLILVVNKSQNTDPTTVKKLAKEFNLNQNNLQMKNKQINDADFTNNLRKAMKGIVQSKPNTVRIEDMSATALELGISVDEECVECKNAKTRAKEITDQIGRIIDTSI